MDFGVLGPLTFCCGSENVAPSAPKQRSVLATLLVHADQLVPVHGLLRELWDEQPPVSALTTLQTYVLNLRRLIAGRTCSTTADVAQSVLITRNGGYMLRTDRGTLDLNKYHSLVAAGRTALSIGDDVEGVELLSRALGLWRGPALVDVQVGRLLESKRRQFEESRLVVLEYMLDAQLRLGMCREVLVELAALTVENPLNEGLHAQYMRALHLSGRRVNALDVFRRLRENLVGELGLDPGPPVQRLHRAILNSEVDFDAHLRSGPPQGDIVRQSACGGARVY